MTTVDKDTSQSAAVDLKRYIRDIPDFPSKGILFRDITPLLQNGKAFHNAIELLAKRSHAHKPDVIVSIESRGLIVGSALANAMGLGVVPVRKAGKLPHLTHKCEYTLEYGNDTLEIHQDALTKGKRVMLVDDLLATGGTMEAAITLVEMCGGEIAELLFLVELTDLKGRDRFAPHSVHSLITY